MSTPTAPDSRSIRDEVASSLLIENLNTSREPQPTEKPSKLQPLEPPDAGWGWVVVASSFLIGVISGILYGGFSMLYVDISESYQIGQATTGWIGSIFTMSSTFPMVVMSALVNRYGCRIVCIAGSLLATGGFVLSWISSSLVLLIFTYGILAGSGYGMMTYTSTIIVQQYFDKRRPFAAGVANAGLSLGTIVTGPVIVYLNEAYGWRGTMLILAGMALNVCVFAAGFRPLIPQSSKPGGNQDLLNPTTGDLHGKKSVKWAFVKEIFDFSLLKQLPLTLYIITLSCMTLSLVPVFQHIPSRAHHHLIPPHYIALLPTVTGVSNFVAKIGCSFAANLKCVDRLVQYTLALLAGGAVTMCIKVAYNFPAFAMYCGIMGIFNVLYKLSSIPPGCAVVLRPTIVVDLVGIEALPRAQALLAVTGGIASLIGTPFAGFLFDTTDDYDLPFYVLGGIQVLGGMVSIVNACVVVRSQSTKRLIKTSTTGHELKDME